MSVEIDNLSVQIEASGEDAIKTLSKLESSLDKLAEKSKGLQKLTSSLAKLKEAISGITSKQVSTLSKLTKALSRLDGKSIKLPSMTSFANGIERISNTDLSGFEAKLRQIADAVRGLNANTTDEGLRGLISDLAAIARNADRAAKAVQGVSRGAVGNNSPPPGPTDGESALSSASAVGRISSIFAELRTKINSATSGLSSFGDKLSAISKTASGPFTRLQKGLSSVTRRVPQGKRCLQWI